MKIHLAILMGTIVAGFASMTMAEDQPAAAAPAVPVEKAAVVSPSVYTCSLCDTMAMKAGKCSMCGMDMKESHVLGMKDGKAMLCDCAAGCACDAKGVKEGKCSCGKEVKTMTPKGMYVCACAGGKCCATMSDKPGKCACGMELKKVE